MEGGHFLPLFGSRGAATTALPSRATSIVGTSAPQHHQQHQQAGACGSEREKGARFGLGADIVCRLIAQDKFADNVVSVVTADEAPGMRNQHVVSGESWTSGPR